MHRHHICWTIDGCAELLFTGNLTREPTRTANVFIGSAYSNGCWTLCKHCLGPLVALGCSQGGRWSLLFHRCGCFISSLSSWVVQAPLPIISCPFHHSTSYLVSGGILFPNYWSCHELLAPDISGLWLWSVTLRTENTFPPGLWNLKLWPCIVLIPAMPLPQGPF